MSGAAYFLVRKLDAADKAGAFDCGQPALNQFLQRYALQNQKANSAQTYVCCHSGAVAGFYSLAVVSVERASAPTRVSKDLARHPVPVMLLAADGGGCGAPGPGPWAGTAQKCPAAHRAGR